MAKAPSLRKDWTKGTQRTRKLSTGNALWRLREWEGTLRGASGSRRKIAGVKPGAVKACAAGRGAESLTQSRGVRREAPGSSTYLKAKAQGNKSMSEKQGTWEGVYDVALRDPCDRVKATLPEPQSPAVEPHTHRYHASEAVPS